MSPPAITSNDIPVRLPVAIRPHLGEGTDSYVRRLAHANHLRPSALHGYLCGPPFWFGKPRLERLAAVSGRTPAILARTLTDTLVPRRRGNLRLSSVPMAPHIIRLYQQIREDAEGHGRSLRALCARHHTDHHTVRTALTAALPPARERPQNIAALPVLAPLAVLIHQRIDQGDSAREIWLFLMDETSVSVSYSTLRVFLHQHRSAHTG
ncbi:hypothetical protein SAMN05216489_07573 [Streptomyces sp. 3213]|uniref:hypothetical protein n=1 Tax=Streptomyces sp. 3213.3 TaxID=1855348 RepID=UPI00089838F1|nr:hypothetical protein [Streptomyces sp. 3213.3]SEE64623.1 hypothetical protein SAMN05216489_07573 [Streptomyces sp. 3213] [Streptomyces sp. 3213.3]